MLQSSPHALCPSLSFALCLCLSLSAPVHLSLQYVYLHISLSMFCSRKNHSSHPLFWLYRPRFLFPAHNSKPCLLFRVDLETKANRLDSAPSPLLFSLSLLFSVKLTFFTHCLHKDFLEIPQVLWCFFSLYVFVSGFWTTVVVLVRVQQQQGQSCIVASKPPCEVCGAKAHRMKQLPGASCKEESCGMLTWQG